MAWMRLPEVPSPMQRTDAGSAPTAAGLVACSSPARPRRRGLGLRRLLRASSSCRVGRSYRLTPGGGASLPCRQATMAPARRSRQAAAGSLLLASGGPGSWPVVEATRATPTARATAITVAIVRRPHRAGSRIGLPALDARPCLIGGSADQLKRGPRMGGPAATQGRVTEMSEAFTLTEDQQLFRREWRRLFEEKFTERAAEIDRTGEFPWGNLKVLAEAGLTGINVPEAYGGARGGPLTPLLPVEEVARVCASTSLIPAVNKLATLPLLFAGTEEQKQRWLPQIADGSAMASYCLTEPGSGSDAAAMRSRAVRDGDDYVINGTKRFITGGGVSKLYIYYAVTNPDAGSKGISAFILEDSMPGFEIGKHEDKLGIRGSPTTEVICSDVRVPAA